MYNKIDQLTKEIEDLKYILSICNGLAFSDYNEALNRKEDELIETILLTKFTEYNQAKLSERRSRND